MRIIPSTKKSGQDGSSESLTVGMIGPGESRMVKTFISGNKEGVVTKCFTVDYKEGFCASVKIVKPELTFERMIVDSEGRIVGNQFICDDLYAVYRVSNVGSGESLPISVMETFPEGIEIDGASSFVEKIGTLDAGETWEERFDVDVDGPTTYSGIAYAKTDEVRLESDVANIDLDQAEIKLTLDGPSTHKMFRTAQYQLTVMNPSDVDAEDIVVTLNRDDFDEADYDFNTQMDLDGDDFAIGDLGAGESRTIIMSADFDEAGTYSLSAVADGFCVADPARASIKTVVEGVPALRLEMIDTVDPVINGEMSSFRVRVKNQGTAEDTDINVSVRLPAELQFVSGSGDSKVSASGSIVTFAQVNDLQSEETVEWTIEVKAVGSGKTKSTVTLKSAAIAGGVSEDEPTNAVSR